MDNRDYAGLRGWLRALLAFEDDLFEKPINAERFGLAPPPANQGLYDELWECYLADDLGLFRTSVGCVRANEPPYRPGAWVEFVFRPRPVALDDLAALSVMYPELVTQIRQQLNQAEQAYSAFQELASAQEPSETVLSRSFPASDTDRAWAAFSDHVVALQRRLGGVMEALGAKPDPPGAPTELLGQLSKRHRTLLTVLWRRERMSWADFATAGWPDEDGGTTEANARNEFRRLHEALKQAGYPGLIDQRAGMVWLDKPK